jgi:hypothetical protein
LIQHPVHDWRKLIELVPGIAAAAGQQQHCEQDRSC